MTRPLVIIEAPYAQSPERMLEYLRACIVDSLRRGESPITSVGTFVTTGALDDLKTAERKEGIEAGLEWYRVAEACVAYVDFGISAGMQQGMYRAQEHGVPIEVREILTEDQS
ncbi:MAG: hypothetical protein WCP82_11815 [Alphaproteobacteria bacterium]